ncbi:MAG: alanine--tRNA ligase [Bacteroidota bacterium]
MNTSTIRSKFIHFFNQKGHTHLPPAPIVNQEDPDLFFINAGMNPFKNIFLGNQTPEKKQVVTSQPCLRVAGKHNDLEEVGTDTYHHTLFEMLGNWSFGSYFKKEAIAWAWELLTQVYEINPENLYVTVFEGQKNSQLDPDIEAYALWKNHLPENHIIYGNKADNFWSMAATGPCGPSTEIHIDLRSDEERKKVLGSQLVNKQHPEVIELWNIVFMQYNQNAPGLLQPLPMKHVDTGMGLERLAMVLQHTKSAYDTDLFKPIITALSQQSNVVYGKDPNKDIAIRVIADHIRAITFAVAEGAIPSSQKEGYVVRRILRRALRYGYTYLNLQKPFLHELTQQVTQTLGKTYPILELQQNLITKLIYQEETAFLKTLQQGVSQFASVIKNLPKTSNTLSGEVVFELYDTYGFPPDLTALMAREKGFNIDEVQFEQCMQNQKARSKKASNLKHSQWHIIHPDLQTTFVGYDQLHTKTKLIKYRTAYRNEEVLYHLVFEKTPFYAEAGGQIGDTGEILTAHQTIQVIDTKKENNLIIHYTKELPENLQSILTCKVDALKRNNASRNHTATHLMVAAMEKVLGSHITQQGSLVHEKGLRFDFNYNEKLSMATLHKIEALVNEKIRENLPLQELREIPLAQAKAMGATATFSEKYGEKVRVVTYGDYCADLCGGTHLQNAGMIGFFKIKTEKGVSTGIRRIEALTGVDAAQWVEEKQHVLLEIGKCLENTQDPLKATQALLAKYKTLKYNFDKIAEKHFLQQKTQLESKMLCINNTYIAIEKVTLQSTEELRKLAFSFNKTKTPHCIVLASIIDQKAYIIVSVSKQTTPSYSAKALIQKLLPYIKGKGGGQNHFAMAHGESTEGIDNALNLAKQLLNNLK